MISGSQQHHRVDTAVSDETGVADADENTQRESDQQTINHSIHSQRPAELGGRSGPEPTRYGDWEKNGRCIDF